MSVLRRAAIIGGGPAGLMAAEALATRGYGVDIYDAMPSFGRKFLMAGKSGLNITHAEDKTRFKSRYHAPDQRLAGMIDAFGPEQVVHWMQGLGIATRTGSTGRVFPQMMKASPLLRAWLTRLQGAGVVLHPRHHWQGWRQDGALTFQTAEGIITVKPAATVLALGGGSWKRLGSDGAWADTLGAEGVPLNPFQPSNCGFLVNWSDHMATRFAGQPVKSVALSVAGTNAPETTHAEFVITKRGVESGGIYTLSARLREICIAHGSAVLTVDLLPDLSLGDVATRLARPRGKQSLSNHLRKAVNLSSVKRALLFEVTSKSDLTDTTRLAQALKSLPLTLTGPAPMDQAISTAGGVSWDGLNDDLMLRARPGHFCAGEMIDWDAPTGGYLITACLAMGVAAGRAAANWMDAL